MFVYNLSIQVNSGIADEWLAWEREVHIPEIMHSKLFDDYKLYRLLDQDDREDPVFIIQYFTSSEERYREYMGSFAPLLFRKALAKWGDQFIVHRTLMGLVH